MSLLRRADELTDKVVALECPSCHARYDGDAIYDQIFGDVLRCSECNYGALIPRYRQSPVTDRFPANVATPYTPLPDALLDHARALGMNSNELLVVIALERYRRHLGDEVWPSRETLSTFTCLSVDQVKRAVNKLVENGLVERRQPGASGKRGRSSNRYCLDPLWGRLAKLEH
jgi:hypothetical protein